MYFYYSNIYLQDQSIPEIFNLLLKTKHYHCCTLLWIPYMYTKQTNISWPVFYISRWISQIPEKITYFTIKNNTCRIKRSQKCLNTFWKQYHCSSKCKSSPRFKFREASESGGLLLSFTYSFEMPGVPNEGHHLMEQEEVVRIRRPTEQWFCRSRRIRHPPLKILFMWCKNVFAEWNYPC